MHSAPPEQRAPMGVLLLAAIVEAPLVKIGARLRAPARAACLVMADTQMRLQLHDALVSQLCWSERG